MCLNNEEFEMDCEISNSLMIYRANRVGDDDDDDDEYMIKVEGFFYICQRLIPYLAKQEYDPVPNCSFLSVRFLEASPKVLHLEIILIAWKHTDIRPFRLEFEKAAS